MPKFKTPGGLQGDPLGGAAALGAVSRGAGPHVPPGVDSFSTRAGVAKQQHVRSRTTTSARVSTRASKPQLAKRPTRQANRDPFVSPFELKKKFDKHGSEVGAATEDQFAAKANELFEKAKLWKVAPDGTIRMYDPEINLFGCYRDDGTPYNLFAPTEGIAYWNREEGTPETDDPALAAAAPSGVPG